MLAAIFTYYECIEDDNKYKYDYPDFLPSLTVPAVYYCCENKDIRVDRTEIETVLEKYRTETNGSHSTNGSRMPLECNSCDLLCNSSRKTRKTFIFVKKVQKENSYLLCINSLVDDKENIKNLKVLNGEWDLYQIEIDLDCAAQLKFMSHDFSDIMDKELIENT